MTTIGKWNRLLEKIFRKFSIYRSLESLYHERGTNLSKLHSTIRENEVRILTLTREKETLSKELDSLVEEMDSLRALHRNSFLELEKAKAEVSTIRASAESHILDLKYQLDWLAIEARGRAIYGLIKQNVTVTPGEVENKVVKMTGRQASRELTREFYERAMKVGMEPSPGGESFHSGEREGA